jgi:hypothetical protein
LTSTQPAACRPTFSSKARSHQSGFGRRRARQIVVRDLLDLTLLAPAQITIYNKKVVDHTVTADGISGNLADVYIQI